MRHFYYSPLLFCKQQVVGSSPTTGSTEYPIQTRYLTRGIAFSFS